MAWTGRTTLSSETYVTFGQQHVHRINNVTLDKDMVALVRDRDHAVELFGTVFATTYNAKPPMQYFPRGLVDLRS